MFVTEALIDTDELSEIEHITALHCLVHLVSVPDYFDGMNFVIVTCTLIVVFVLLGRIVTK